MNVQDRAELFTLSSEENLLECVQSPTGSGNKEVSKWGTFKIHKHGIVLANMLRVKLLQDKRNVAWASCKTPHELRPVVQLEVQTLADSPLTPLAALLAASEALDKDLKDLESALSIATLASDSLHSTMTMN